MKEVITYYIVFIIFLLSVIGVAGSGLSALLAGSVTGMVFIFAAALAPLAWQWWLSYVLKGCAGKQNWLMPD